MPFCCCPSALGRTDLVFTVPGFVTVGFAVLSLDNYSCKDKMGKYKVFVILLQGINLQKLMPGSDVCICINLHFI